jgi:hypothetical protein
MSTQPDFQKANLALQMSENFLRLLFDVGFRNLHLANKQLQADAEPEQSLGRHWVSLGPLTLLLSPPMVSPLDNASQQLEMQLEFQWQDLVRPSSTNSGLLFLRMELAIDDKGITSIAVTVVDELSFFSTDVGVLWLADLPKLAKRQAAPLGINNKDPDYFSGHASLLANLLYVQYRIAKSVVGPGGKLKADAPFDAWMATLQGLYVNLSQDAKTLKEQTLAGLKTSGIFTPSETTAKLVRSFVEAPGATIAKLAGTFALASLGKFVLAPVQPPGNTAKFVASQAKDDSLSQIFSNMVAGAIPNPDKAPVFGIEIHTSIAGVASASLQSP